MGVKEHRIYCVRPLVLLNSPILLYIVKQKVTNGLAVELDEAKLICRLKLCLPVSQYAESECLFRDLLFLPNKHKLQFKFTSERKCICNWHGFGFILFILQLNMFRFKIMAFLVIILLKKISALKTHFLLLYLFMNYTCIFIYCCQFAQKDVNIYWYNIAF